MPTQKDTAEGIEGFSARLRQLIGDESVSKFAQDVGLGDNLVRKYLEGSNPGADKLIIISDAKNVDLRWLATGRGEPFPKSDNVVRFDPDTPYPPAPPPRHFTTEEPSPEEAEFVTVPWYDARASAGLGVENGDAPESRPFKFRRDWWAKHIGLSPERCFSMEIAGDSMWPRLTEAHLPIFQATKEMLGEGIYVFRIDGEVFVKNLERIPGRGFIAKSENPKYTDWEIGDGSGFSDFTIIGRLMKKQTMQEP